ncbi:hypothetical protein BDD12DRAFT_920343 [Trichophaea hybrida]|nr:hypothetical protein BDD12DRAFT_920343 [Trichophaea hybrida]
MKLGLEGGTRGFGKSIVEVFLQEGVNVSYCARTVTEEEFSNFPLAGAEFGRIDTLICNVFSVAMSGEIETWHNSFNIDFMSAIHLTNQTVPYHSLSPHASILIMSSFAERENFVAHGVPCPTAYEWVEDLTGKIPLGGRVGTPQKVADTVVFLSSPRSGYTSGANVLITRGFHTGTAF